MRDERERRNGRDWREHRVRHEPKFEVRGFEVPETSNREPSSISLVSPVSFIGYAVVRLENRE